MLNPYYSARLQQLFDDRDVARVRGASRDHLDELVEMVIDEAARAGDEIVTRDDLRRLADECALAHDGEGVTLCRTAIDSDVGSPAWLRAAELVVALRAEAA